MVPKLVKFIEIIRTYSQARPFLSICLTFIRVEWQVSLLLLAHPIGTVITLYLLYSREAPCNMYCLKQDISQKWHDYHHQLMSELRAKWESICSVWCLVSHHYPRQHARSPTRPKVHNQRNDHHIEIQMTSKISDTWVRDCTEHFPDSHIHGRLLIGTKPHGNKLLTWSPPVSC